MQPVQDFYSAVERERLILEHLPQVRWIAASIHERLPASVSLEDVVSTGIIGLIQAVDKFDGTKNASLRTYAEFRIRGAILDSLRDLDGMSVHKRKRTRVVQEAIVALERKLGRSPCEDEIATQLGITVREYHQWLSDLQGVTLGSLDSFAADGTDNGPISYLADPRQEDPGVSIERAELHALLAHGISCMPETERTILDLYYTRELTLAEIAKVLGVHLSRVSQIKVQAVLRLRSYLAGKLNRPGKHQKGN